MSKHLFPALMIVLYLCQSGRCIWLGEYWRVVYWLCAAVMTVSIALMGTAK